MALWSFKKKDKADQEFESQQEPVAEEFVAESEETDGVEDLSEDILIDGTEGPFDGDTVDIEESEYAKEGSAVLNLGSMKIPLPNGSEVQVEMGEQGPKMLHVLTPYGRITPVAFAAPSSTGQWRLAAKEIAEGMRADGLTVSIEQGPWGREIVGSKDDGGGVVRIIGVDGPRWMLRMTVAAPVESAAEMTELARDITANTYVYRGSDPILAGNALPVALPGPLAEQIQAEMQRRYEEAQAQAARGTGENNTGA